LHFTHSNMSLIVPTTLQKKKLKEMIQKLYPQYQYVKFGPCGIIFLSKSFWYFLFKRKTINITELCTVYIPERLEKLDSRIIADQDVFPYQRVYNKYSHIILDLLHHRANNIIDYLYDEYTYVKYGIHKTYHTIHNTLPKTTYTLSELLVQPVKKDSIVLSPLSNTYIKQALKHWKDASTVLNHPVLRSKYLNTWFRSEVKQSLKRIYNIQIIIS
jgi:hypothetical protein